MSEHNVHLVYNYAPWIHQQAAHEKYYLNKINKLHSLQKLYRNYLLLINLIFDLKIRFSKLIKSTACRQIYFIRSEYLGAKLLCQKADKGHYTVSGKADIIIIWCLKR